MQYSQHRPVTLATHGLVVAPHYLASQAGLDMLKAGGNAIDAAIATSATLQVVYPFVCGLGGDVFVLLHDGKSGQLHALNGSGHSAQAATIERYQQLGYTTMPSHGIHSVTVPGCVDGWAMAEDRFGRLGLERVLAPAIRYAEEGFPLGPDLHRSLSRMQTFKHTHPSWHAHFLPDGAVPPVGSIVRYPSIARTFRAIASGGRDAFYRGALAEQIASFFAREGGLITQDDLAQHVGEWVTPLSVRFGGLDVYELPPNTQGITALQMLGIVEGLELGDSPISPETVHLEVETKKLAFADRDKYQTDLRHMRVDPARLIDSTYLAERRQRIDASRALATVMPGSFAGDTVYMCAADADGNAVSLIQSNYMGFGSGLVVEGTGIALQNRGAYFSLDPQEANALAPHKRTLHTLIPSMAMRDGKPAVVFGTMGGDGQAQTHLQVYTALERYGLNIQAAIEMPRWVHGRETANEREALLLEQRFPAETAARLTALGHVVMEAGAWDSRMGYAQGIVLNQATGVFGGGADPRAESAAVGW